jgi:hypothetical protein
MELKPYNLDEKFYEFPKPIQKVLQDIKPFVNYDYLYKLVSEIDDELDKKVKEKKAIENNGGMTWDTNVTRNYSKQKNLINFVLNNFIMMERSYEFLAINKKLIKISIVRQMQNEYFTFDKMELFAIIKYISYKDLIELLDEFESKQFKIDTKTLNWLTIKCFPNVIILFYENKTLYSHFINELQNILYILSLVVLNTKQIKIILKQLKILIHNSNFSLNLNIYQQINKLIDSQESINKEDLIDILELMINNIICNKGSKRDFQVIEDNFLWSPFKHLSQQNISYDNKSLISNFLNELKQYSEKQKIQLSKGFLSNIYLISNEEIKKMIKDFMLNINLDSLKNYGLKISFKLFLAIQKFIEIDENLIEEIKQYPERDGDNIYFLDQITGQVRYLVEELKIKDLKELLVHLLKVIDEVN